MCKVIYLKNHEAMCLKTELMSQVELLPDWTSTFYEEDFETLLLCQATL